MKFNSIGTQYYDKDGLPLDRTEWAQKFEDPEYKIIEKTELWWNGFISTIWLGLDHNFTEEGDPLIFETMIFCDDPDWYEYQMRYTNIKDAKKDHKRLKKLLNDPKFQPKIVVEGEKIEDTKALTN